MRARGRALWAITAAGCVAVGLAGWTWSARYGLGAAAIIALPLGLLWGTRGAAASPGADTDPDASGHAPETARTIPDTPGQQPADQHGDHPDTPGTTTGYCEVIQLDGGPARITGDQPLDDTSRRHLATILAAARRRHAAEHPESGDAP